MQIISLSDRGIYDGILALVRSLYPSPILQADTEAYRKQIRTMQDELNARRYADRILKAINITALMRSDLYLRAARPNREEQEAVTWHRESFYGCPKTTLNVWMPILNCTKENSIRYVPGSEEIADEAIQLSQEEDASVPRGSAGHSIGLLYAPKTIIGGVDFSLAKSMYVPEGMVSVFPGELIHGAAQNKSDDIRFSVDFRILAKAFTG